VLARLVVESLHVYVAVVLESDVTELGSRILLTPEHQDSPQRFNEPFSRRNLFSSLPPTHTFVNEGARAPLP
jgi:hypothetical protein